MIQKPPTRSTESAHRELSMTLPFGVRARVLATSTPALIIEESSVTPRS